MESALKDEIARKKFQERALFDYIVLFDDGSYADDLGPGNALSGLKQAIFTVGNDSRDPVTTKNIILVRSRCEIETRTLDSRWWV